MTSKERVHAALEGRPVDRMPVGVMYRHLYEEDHFAELTGRPAWHMHQWLHASPEEYADVSRLMAEKAPFDILNPVGAPSRRQRNCIEFAEIDGTVYRLEGGQRHGIPQPITPGHARDYHANETQTLFDKKDVDERVKPVKAEDAVATGCNDYIEAVVAAMGKKRFVLCGGGTGTIWACGQYVGQTNLLAMLIEKPDFVEYLSRKILACSIETIRRIAAAGVDGIWIDDAMGTSDMISVEHYERFSLPYVTEMVREIQGAGCKAILVYFGGVMDRLEQIASTGADALAAEASMKNYTNDIDEIAERIGDRMSLFGNIDPFGVLEKGTDAALAAEVARQAAAGRKARGFVMCTGSPITPGTPLGRVQRFIELARNA